LAGVISCCSNSGLGASVSVSDGATWTSLSGGNSETSEKLGPRPVAWPSSIIGSGRNAGAAVSTSSTAERIDCERGLAELSHPAAATAAFALVSGPVIISDGTAWGVLAEHAAGFGLEDVAFAGLIVLSLQRSKSVTNSCPLWYRASAALASAF